MGLARVTRATRVTVALADRIRRHEPSPAVLLARSATRWPHRVVVLDGESITLAELLERVRDLAGALHARRVGPGSTVGLLCRHHAGMIEAAFAALWVGADITVIDVEVDADELGQTHRRSALDVLVHDADVRLVVVRAALGVTTLVIDGHGSGSVAAARSFGHPAPPPIRSGRALPPALDGSALASALAAITRPVPWGGV